MTGCAGSSTFQARRHSSACICAFKLHACLIERCCELLHQLGLGGTLVKSCMQRSTREQLLNALYFEQYSHIRHHRIGLHGSAKCQQPPSQRHIPRRQRGTPGRGAGAAGGGRGGEGAAEVHCCHAYLITLLLASIMAHPEVLIEWRTQAAPGIGGACMAVADPAEVVLRDSETNSKSLKQPV